MAKSILFSKKAVILIIVLAVVIAAAAVILLRAGPHEEVTDAVEDSHKITSNVYVDSTPVFMSMEDMVSKSTLVVYGKVSGRSDAFKFSPHRAGSPMAYTDVYFEPIQVLKGEAEQNQLPIRILGGTVDGITYDSDTEPKLIDETEYVLFLYTPQEESSEDEYYYVCGINQGCFKKSGESFVSISGTSFTLDEFAALL